jgi:hypothetical protein
MTHYDVIKNWLEKKADIFEISSAEVENSLSTFSTWPGQMKMTAGTAGRRFRDVKSRPEKADYVGVESIEEIRKEGRMSIWLVKKKR